VLAFGDYEERQVQEVVDRETRAWDTEDVDLLLSVFHPDIVWPWRPSANGPDPESWVWGIGRFDERRWRAAWEQVFAVYALVRNCRRTQRISISGDRSVAFAVVEVDTLWRRQDDGVEVRWKGRAFEVYTLLACEWKLTMHVRLLDCSS